MIDPDEQTYCFRCGEEMWTPREVSDGACCECVGDKYEDEPTESESDVSLGLELDDEELF